MAITADYPQRSKRRPKTQRNFPVAGAVRIFEGALVVVDPTGYARPARTATGDLCVGRAIFAVDNLGGAAGAVPEGVEVECDFAILCRNSGGGDAIAVTNIGADCYLVDDETVALTDGGGTRSRAGRVWNVTAEGVWLSVDR